MRRVSCIAVACLALAGATEASAHSLDFRKAKARAQSFAERHAQREGYTAWDLSGPFRLDAHRLVWAWYGEGPESRACVAQLVVRFRSRTTRRTVGYFRNQVCD